MTGPIGFVGLFLAASGLFSSMRTTLHRVFRIESGAWVLLSKLRDLGLVLPALVYFLLVAAAMPVSAYLAADRPGKLRFSANPVPWRSAEGSYGLFHS